MKAFMYLIANTNPTIQQYNPLDVVGEMVMWHPLYQVDYNDISISVHGGLTYSQQLGDYWVIGFDTCHYSDNADNCDMPYVLNETKTLLEQVENYKA